MQIPYPANFNFVLKHSRGGGVACDKLKQKNYALLYYFEEVMS